MKGARGQGRSMKTWEQCVKDHMKLIGSHPEWAIIIIIIIIINSIYAVTDAQIEQKEQHYSKFTIVRLTSTVFGSGMV